MSLDDIVAACAVAYGVSVDEVWTLSRRQPVAEARQLAMLLAWGELGLSIAEVGRRLCRDGSTVSYGISRAHLRLREPEARRALRLLGIT